VLAKVECPTTESMAPALAPTANNEASTAKPTTQVLNSSRPLSRLRGPDHLRRTRKLIRRSQHSVSALVRPQGITAKVFSGLLVALDLLPGEPAILVRVGGIEIEIARFEELLHREHPIAICIGRMKARNIDMLDLGD
jgi:hypothetical protein